jgi:hypothetical protein
VSDRDWDKELAAIDKQLASVSDEALAAEAARQASPPSRPAPPTAGTSAVGGSAGAGAAPSARAGAGARDTALGTTVTRAAAIPTPTGVILRLALAVGLGVAIVFWPYANRCGVGLAGYLAAVLAVAGAGWWTAVTTWRARTGRAHVLALALVAWGLILTAIEILPRVGYATDPARISWGCDA